jgi:hypothetical protein
MPALIINLLKTYWKPLTILVTLTIWSWFWYDAGRDAVKAKWEAEKARIVLAQREVEKHNIKTAWEIASGFSKTKDSIYSDFDNRINSLPEPTSSDAGKGNATSRTDAATACSGLSQANKRKFLTLAREAEINTQQLIALQKWVRETR